MYVHICLCVPSNRLVCLLLLLFVPLARTTGLCKTASRVFIFDYGGTLLHKEKYDIEVKKTMSAISGRKPTGEGDSVWK